MTNNSVRPDYGIDAPGLVRFFWTGGSAAALLCLGIGVSLRGYGLWGLIVTLLLGVAAAYLLGMGSLMVYWSRVTKVKERETVLDELRWRGDERVLDVGCGRGLMLIGAAKRLTTGRAVGIDIWQASDQSASPEAAAENARLEGVSDRVEVQTADMRALPFDNQSFDAVVSHWVVHNLESESDRDLALFEMERVLRPGGNLVLCDIENRDAYLARLKELGFTDCRMVFSPRRDSVLGAVSFGSFRPTAIFARKPA